MGSSSLLYCFARKLGAFSGRTLRLRLSRNISQFTKRYLYFFPMSLYSRQSLRVAEGEDSQMARLTQQSPCSTAQSRAVSPLLLTIAALQPLLSRYSTTSSLPFLAEPMRAVSPVEVCRSILAAYFSRSSLTSSRLLLAAARCRGVVLQLRERSSSTRLGLLAKSCSILGVSFFSMYQKRYSLEVQLWVMLFTAPMAQLLSQNIISIANLNAHPAKYQLSQQEDLLRQIGTKELRLSGNKQACRQENQRFITWNANQTAIEALG